MEKSEALNLTGAQRKLRARLLFVLEAISYMVLSFFEQRRACPESAEGISDHFPFEWVLARGS